MRLLNIKEKIIIDFLFRERTLSQQYTSSTLNIKIPYKFSAKPWKYSGAASWHFVSLPAKISKEIRKHFQWQEEGWGRLKANAKIGKTEWQTAIWFDTKLNLYLLPLKAEVRRKENISAGKKYAVMIQI